MPQAPPHHVAVHVLDLEFLPTVGDAIVSAIAVTTRRKFIMKRIALFASLLALLASLLVGAGPSHAAPQHEITYDHYSLKVDGERVVLWSGEFHYFRLPSPELWRDVLEKIRAAGFNGVSLYFDWAYHSPRPGAYDFSGVRDIDRLLRLTDELGLYVVARPGPYINAETTGGGFPAWLKTVPGRARSYDAGYREAYRDWLGHVNPIIARHQVTRGGSAGQDVPLALRFGGDEDRQYRVLIFLNGWNLGQYVSGGPQHDFVLPACVLAEHGTNTLALAVITTDPAPGGPGPVTLVPLANHRGGV